MPDSSGNRRGYRLTDLADAFARYLSQEPSEASETSQEQAQLTDAWTFTDASKCQTEATRQSEDAANSNNLTLLTDADEYGQTDDSCCFCNTHMPAHMTSQRQRGYCSSPACREKARATV